MKRNRAIPQTIKSVLISFWVFASICVQAQIPEPNTGSKIISMDSLFKAKEMESIGKNLPEFTSRFDSNRSISLDSIKGKVVFINFWFEACPPCIAELGALNELYRKFSRDENFMFLSFTFDEPGEIVRLKNKFRIKYPVASVSQQECYRLNQNNGFPTSIILNREGIIAHLFTGGNTDKTKAREFIVDTVYKSINLELKK